MRVSAWKSKSSIDGLSDFPMVGVHVVAVLLALELPFGAEAGAMADADDNGTGPGAVISCANVSGISMVYRLETNSERSMLSASPIADEIHVSSSPEKKVKPKSKGFLMGLIGQ